MVRRGSTTGPGGTAVAERAAPRPPERVTGDSGFRGDVEGLRALAVCAVLAYHAGVGAFGGGYVGVDVFFVVSGFLITGLLLRELERTGTVSLVRFYVRRMRRLLPLTLVVLGSVVALAWLLLSPVERRNVFGDVIASALYVVNWRQAQQAVDYSAIGAAASPVQHFWSLSVEEQFYLVWPLLLLAVFKACRRPERRRARLAWVLGTVAVASLAYAVFLTAQEGGAAYFSTLTRAWELAAGGLLALVPARRWRELPRRAPAVPAVLAVGGVAAVAVAVVGFSDVTPFPGVAALLPVLGTVALIAAGSASERTPVARVLKLRPVRYVGRISYSWYLWHWPAIVFATAAFDGLPASLLLAVVALSWIPAALTHTLVEEYFRRAPAFASTGRGLTLGAACTALAVVAGAAAWAAVPRVPLASPEQVEGVRALHDGTGPQRTADALRPLPEQAAEDRGTAHDDGCLVGQRGTKSPECVYGDPSSGTTVVLFGDSHAMQYHPALDRVAEGRGWRLVVLTKSGCTPADVPTYNGQLKREYTECDTWRDRALQRIERENPAMVVTGNRATQRTVEDGERMSDGHSAGALREGYVHTLDRLQGSGAKVVVLADNPHPPRDMPSCVSDSLDSLTDCAFPRSEGLGFPRVNADAAKRVSGVSLIDPADVLCRDGTCPAVVGNALVYRNGAHVTATYMRTLTGWLGDALPSSL